jgi:hypothetical protein
MGNEYLTGIRTGEGRFGRRWKIRKEMQLKGKE